MFLPRCSFTCLVLYISSFTVLKVEGDKAGEFGEASFEKLVQQKEEEEEQEKSTRSFTDIPVDYGVDVSFPIHNAHISGNHARIKQQYESMDYLVAWPLGDRQGFYEEFLQGCRDFHGKNELCDMAEKARLANNMNQPQAMKNYTELGFSTHQIPDDLVPLLKSFWEENNENGKTEESWPEGSSSVNYWETPTELVDLDDSNLPGHKGLSQKLTLAVQEILEEWIGESLTPCALYGIRVFRDGAIVPHHVDQLPFVVSAMINVAQDLAFDWPMEMIGHDGMAYNVTLQPGEMLLYEGHSAIHGRPFSLKGSYQANIFVHFEPMGYTLQHEASSAGTLAATNELSPEELYRKAFQLYDPDKVTATSDGLEDIPPYIERGSEEELRWKGIQQDARPIYAKKDKTSEKHSDDSKEARYYLDLHHYASTGNLAKLKGKLEKTPDAVHRKDKNGWMLIHEAARGGHSDVIKELVNFGSDINTRTNHGKGASPLWWADQTHGSKHPATKYLQKLGALNIGPDR